MKTGTLGKGDELVQAYRRDIDPTLLTAQEELDLGRLVSQGTPEQAHQAKADLVTHNLRLVLSIAPRFAGRGLDFADLIQAGNEGLLVAAAKFDYRMGRRFSTYATFWIRQAMHRLIEDQATLIRIPVHAHQAVREINRQGGLPVNRGRQRLRECVQAALDVIAGVESLDREIAEHRGPETLTLGHLLMDGDPLVDEQASTNEMAERVQTVVDDLLTDKERKVVRARYGLDDGRPCTLHDLAQAMGVSRERVRQVQVHAEEKLRRSAELARLADYYLHD